MRLSLVVGTYNMQREVPRTLETMSSAFQQVPADQYEIIIVDNGSASRFDQVELRSIAENCRYVYVDNALPSPTAAINQAVADSAGDLVTVVIDGARMFSPGILRHALTAAEVFDDPFVYAPSLHLGPQLQNDSSYGGYDQTVEDGLLQSVPWKADGYTLFSISNIDCVPERLIRPTFESNCFTVRRSTWERIGGYHPGFSRSVAGGIANWELFARYLGDDRITPVLLVGEATFHQFHQGASTNQPRAGHPIRTWLQEHQQIVGAPYAWPEYEPFLFGAMRPELDTALFKRNVQARIALAQDLSHAGKHDAATAIGRSLCDEHPNDPGKLRILAETLERSSRRAEALETIGRALHIAPTQAELHIANAVICVGLGRLQDARACYGRAIELDPLLPEAYFHRAHLELRERRVEHAISDFEQALHLEPSPPPHYRADLDHARRLLLEGEPDAVAVGAPQFVDADELLDGFMTSVRKFYAPALDAAVIEHHAAQGSFSNHQLAALCEIVTDTAPARVLIVGGFLGASTAAVLGATTDVGSSLVTIDPNLRHRVFSTPLDHARSFVQSDRVQFVNGFFGERSRGGAVFDLCEFAPKFDVVAANEMVDQAPLVVPDGRFDLVLIDADAGAELALAASALPLLAQRATLVLAGRHRHIVELLAHDAPSVQGEIVEAGDGTAFTVIRISAGG